MSKRRGRRADDPESKSDWVTLWLWDRGRESLVERYMDLRWASWPEVIVRRDRYFVLDESNSVEAHYQEVTVHFADHVNGGPECPS